jgi:phospho-N-acetylmuramoyl-pentapeptide-transferase
MMDWTAAFLISALTTAIVAVPVMKGIVALKSKQTIHAHAPETHQVKQGTPTMGGIMVLIGVAVALLASESKDVYAAVALLLGFGFVGFADDYIVPKMMPGKRGLGWIPKLGMQFAVGAGALLLDGRFSNPFMLAAGLFVVLFFTNAYNFADGLDALAGSLAVVMSAGFGVLALMQGDPVAALIAATIAGGFTIFLWFNAPPAKIFMGDVGALAIGAVFGYLYLRIGIKADGAYDMAIQGPLMVLSGVMFAELIPVPMQIFWVKVFKKRLFPYTPIHHAFEKAGMAETTVVWRFLVVQIVLVIAAIGWASWI